MLNYKPFEQLTLQDDFMFFAVMRNPKHCKPMLERILGIKIRKIKYPIPQKTIDVRADSKSVRLDIYTEDKKNTVYNVEMQTVNKKDLPKRSRFYQDLIDLDLLEKGGEYKQLKNSYVIFICTFDPFGKGYYRYQFENVCKEDSKVKLEDGTMKIFLNTKGTNDVDKELETMLKYIETGIPSDDYTRSLDEDVHVIRENRKWRREYMTLQMKYNEIMDEARTEGEIKSFIRLVCKKLQKNKSIENIIDEMEAEDNEIIMIKNIVDIAPKHAYEVERIYENLVTTTIK